MNTIPEYMKAIILTGHGDFDKLEYKEKVKTPSPSANEVLVEVHAAGVNNTDINTRIAWYSKSDADSDDASWSGNALQFPRIQGADVCGTIVDVGENIDKNRIGERVLINPCIKTANGKALEQPWYFGSECDGGFAEYTAVDSTHARAIKSDMTDIQLASFPCSYSTAENMLTKSKVKSGEIVLITGASGGVGSAVVQLAKARGATVIAITSQTKALEIMDLGASKTLNRKDSFVETLGRNSVDVVIDMVAGEKWPELLDVLKPGGRYAVAGAIAGAEVNLDIRTLYLKDLSFFGCTILEPEVFENLIKRIENKDIKPLVAKTFPLSQIVEAQEFFLEKKHVGKVVLQVK
ncbi:alcohol dehydrogenase family protein [Aureibacter tunicatorum]|uniref:NADPH:quinone reductase-like Zn-dependent oxidoreductase n=1 Tax=Aureibacter tunicatorum TaxID=866807 RepID=A0AAE4BV26_9BACT|nr:alcohol dehydrogenase family protein [Aureibacter tunicatorum]MDR6241437.1 NADPH:quinone reductase-like Zn-dependent oxidoreductase [Aureibacter tunicatorum]BDD06718.1 alcohol dehydrogenase [Aureibacter tunicatorum]